MITLSKHNIFPVSPTMLQAAATCPRCAKGMLEAGVDTTAADTPEAYKIHPALPSILKMQAYQVQLFNSVVSDNNARDDVGLRAAIRNLQGAKVLSTGMWFVVNDCGTSRLFDKEDEWLGGHTGIFISPGPSDVDRQAYYIMLAQPGMEAGTRLKLHAEMLLIIGAWREVFDAHHDISVLHGRVLDSQNWEPITSWESVMIDRKRQAQNFPLEQSTLLAEVGDAVVTYSTQMLADKPLAIKGPLCAGCPVTNCEYKP